MHRRSLRRLVALPSLALFLQTAAFSPYLHACCMEMEGGGHAHGVSVEAESGAGGDASAHGHTSHGASAHNSQHGDAAHSGVHAGHGDAPGVDAHHGQGADEGGTCCCTACKCCVGGAAAVGTHLAQLGVPSGATPGSSLVPASPDVRTAAFLLPFANGPPQGAIQLV